MPSTLHPYRAAYLWRKKRFRPCHEAPNWASCSKQQAELLSSFRDRERRSKLRGKACTPAPRRMRPLAWNTREKPCYYRRISTNFAAPNASGVMRAPNPSNCDPAKLSKLPMWWETLFARKRGAGDHSTLPEALMENETRSTLGINALSEIALNVITERPVSFPVFRNWPICPPKLLWARL